MFCTLSEAEQLEFGCMYVQSPGTRSWSKSRTHDMLTLAVSRTVRN